MFIMGQDYTATFALLAEHIKISAFHLADRVCELCHQITLTIVLDMLIHEMKL